LPTASEVPGIDHAITSDDIFWRVRSEPGRTLVVGGSYIALECAGFLQQIGYPVTVAVRSILLRGFDQQAANMIGQVMEVASGVQFLRPTTIKRLERKVDGIHATIFNHETNATSTQVFDTVLYAIGRYAQIEELGVQQLGLKINAEKVVTDDEDRTSIRNIFAVGDVAYARPELTPVAIQAGVLLARRLYGNSTIKMNYQMIPTTVFTPVEYGCVGMSEEEAKEKLGAQNVDAYLSRYAPIETLAAHHELDESRIRSKAFHTADDKEKGVSLPCLAKLVVDKSRNERIVGFHFVGPNAGEVTQGFALALRAGVTKQDFDLTVGIHPTAAEEFVNLNLSVTTSSNMEFCKAAGCGGGRCG